MRLERKIKKFYLAWSPTVLAFACLLLGEGVDAERTTVEVFQAYVSRGLDLDVLQLPALPLIYALDAARKTLPPAVSGRPRRMEETVILLPWKERAVFRVTRCDGSRRHDHQRDCGDSRSRSSEGLDECTTPAA